MDAGNQSNWPNSLVAVISGAAVTVSTAFLLSPLAEMASSPFFELNFGVKDPGITTNDIIFMMIIAAWLTIAAITGGLATAYIGKSTPYRHAWVLIFLSFIFYGFIFWDSPNARDLYFIIPLAICTSAGFLAGARIGKHFASKRKAKQQPVS